MSLQHVGQQVADRFKVGWKKVSGIRLRSSATQPASKAKPPSAPISIQMTDWSPKLSRQSGSLTGSEAELSNSASVDSEQSDTTQAPHQQLSGSFTEASSKLCSTG